MNTKSCKNCQTPLLEEDNYCRNCGGKVIRNRLTVRALIQDFYAQTFKWDNRYLTTIKHLLLYPKQIFEEYISGTRKKYVNPITFLAVCAAIVLLVYNQFADEYIAISNALNDPQGDMLNNLLKGFAEGQGLEYDPSKAPEISQRMQDNENVQRTVLKYFNAFTFMLMPFYGLLAYWTYGKPYNYAEHLAIGSYLQGFLFLVGTITFLLSVFVSPSFFYGAIFFSFFLYSYAYGKLYELSIGKAILKFFKFLGILILSVVIIMILVGLLGALIGYLFSSQFS